MNNFFLIGIIFWLFHGVGHLMLKRWKRGLIIGSLVWAMVLIGILSGDAYYPGFDYKDVALLYLLNVFVRLGNVFGAFISFYLQADPPQNVAALATFEYGGRFLEVAGLLNYLAVLDAVDIQIGRKK